jgi:periplasmic protein TonB
MAQRIFEDLVVSAPSAPSGRRAALMPLSGAVHAVALGIVLLVPTLKRADLPTPALPAVRWTIPRKAVDRTPPPVVVTPPLRVHGGNSIAPRVDTPVARPPSVVPTGELPLEAITDDPPAVCLRDCDVAPGPGVPGPGPGPAGDGPGGAHGDAPTVRPGGVIQPPERVAYVAPVYPPIAQAAGVGGVVILDCTIAPDGRVVDVRVLSGHPLLNEAALAAVRQWRYRATRLDGVPVAVLMTVTVRFVARR